MAELYMPGVSTTTVGEETFSGARNWRRFQQARGVIINGAHLQSLNATGNVR